MKYNRTKDSRLEYQQNRISESSFLWIGQITVLKTPLSNCAIASIAEPIIKTSVGLIPKYQYMHKWLVVIKASQMTSLAEWAIIEP